MNKERRRGFLNLARKARGNGGLRFRRAIGLRMLLEEFLAGSLWRKAGAKPECQNVYRVSQHSFPEWFWVYIATH